MMTVDLKTRIRPSSALKGRVRPPGDKSISHRALMIGAIAEGETVIRKIAPGHDVAHTTACLQALGSVIERGSDNRDMHVTGSLLKVPSRDLYCGNSGTTARLLTGLLTGMGMPATITGDESLSARPMERVAIPLELMGARITLATGGTLPITLIPGALSGITYESQVPSAQVKSCVLLAGLGADGITKYQEAIRSRDHTERMLAGFGASITSRIPDGETGPHSVTLVPGDPLTCREVDIPGDISSALYLVVAALLLPSSELLIEDVGLNPGRRQALDVLISMGADIEILDERTVCHEPRANLLVRHSLLKGTGVSGPTVTWLIDEVPILAVAAAFAEGESSFRDVGELRLKECDRISAITSNLKALGVEVEEYSDGFSLKGGDGYDGAEFISSGDHRIALAFHVAALACSGESTIHDYDSVSVSWPGFRKTIEALGAG